MLPRSGIYYAVQHLHHARRGTTPPGKTAAPEVRPAGDREELGEFVRLWLVILAGVAAILGCSFLVVLACGWLVAH